MNTIETRVRNTASLFTTLTPSKAPSYDTDSLDAIVDFRKAFIDYLVEKGVIDTQTHKTTKLAMEQLPALGEDARKHLDEQLLQVPVNLVGREDAFTATFNLGDLLRDVIKEAGDTIEDILFTGSALPHYLEEYFSEFASTLGLTPDTPLYNKAREALMQGYADVDLCVVLRPSTLIVENEVHQRINKVFESVKGFIGKDATYDTSSFNNGYAAVSQKGLQTHFVYVEAKGDGEKRTSDYDRFGIISFTPQSGKRIDILVRQSLKRSFLSVHDALQLSLFPLLSEEKSKEPMRPTSDNPEGGWLCLIDRMAKTIRIPNIETVDPCTTLAAILCDIVKGYHLHEPDADKRLLEAFLSAVRGNTDATKIPRWFAQKQIETTQDPKTPRWVLPLIETLRRARDNHLKDHPKAILLLALETVNTLAKNQDTAPFLPHFWKQLCMLERGINAKDGRTVDAESALRVHNVYIRDCLYGMEACIDAHPQLTTDEQWIVARATVPHLCADSLKNWREIPLKETIVPGSPFDLALFAALRKTRPDLAIQLLTTLLQRGLSPTKVMEMAIEMVKGASKRAEISKEFSKYLWSKEWGVLGEELHKALQKKPVAEFPRGTIEFLTELFSNLSSDVAERFWGIGQQRGDNSSHLPIGYVEMALKLAKTHQEKPEHIQRLMAITVPKSLRNEAYNVIRKYLDQHKTYDDENIKIRIDSFFGDCGYVGLQLEKQKTCRLIREETPRIASHQYFKEAVTKALQQLNEGNRLKVAQLYFLYYFIKEEANKKGSKPFTKQNITQVADALDGQIFWAEANTLRKIDKSYIDKV